MKLVKKEEIRFYECSSGNFCSLFYSFRPKEARYETGLVTVMANQAKRLTIKKNIMRCIIWRRCIDRRPVPKLIYKIFSNSYWRYSTSWKVSWSWWRHNKRINWCKQANNNLRDCWEIKFIEFDHYLFTIRKSSLIFIKKKNLLSEQPNKINWGVAKPNHFNVFGKPQESYWLWKIFF